MKNKGSTYSRNPAHADREIISSLAGFLPEKIFDFHAHIYRAEDVRPATALTSDGPTRDSAACFKYASRPCENN